MPQVGEMKGLQTDCMCVVHGSLMHRVCVGSSSLLADRLPVNEQLSSITIHETWLSHLTLRATTYEPPGSYYWSASATHTHLHSTSESTPLDAYFCYRS